MLARHESEPKTKRTPPRSQGNPSTFMFIDSSNGGVNAKPDRVIRSFVMKSVRHKRSWSTRPRSLAWETSKDAGTRRRSTSRVATAIEQVPKLACPEKCDDIRSSDDQPPTIPPSSSGSSDADPRSSSRRLASLTSPGASKLKTAGKSSDIRELLKQQPSSLLQLSEFNIDFTGPFGNLPVALDRNGIQLLQQFKEAALPRLLPLDIHMRSKTSTAEWAKACLQSAMGGAFVYAAITTSARARGLWSEQYKYKGLAIERLNAALLHDPPITDDGTIAAVLMLLALEEADLSDPRKLGDARPDSVKANKAHLKGLTAMIQQRGGLAELEENRCLQVFLLMHSVAQCVATFGEPYAIMSDDRFDADCPHQSPRLTHAVIETLRPFEMLRLSNSLCSIITRVTTLTTELNEYYITGSCTSDVVELQKHTSLLMYCVYKWVHEHPSRVTNDRGMESPLERSITLALLIFLSLATEPNIASFGPRLLKAVIRLRSSLEAVPIDAWKPAPELLLWTTTMGALGASNLSQGHPTSRCTTMSYLFAQLCLTSPTYASSHLIQCTADALLTQMRHQCLWVPFLFDDRAKRLWTQTGLCAANTIGNEEIRSEVETLIDDEYALGRSTALRFFAAEARSESVLELRMSL